MIQYQEFLESILSGSGNMIKGDRTGTGTYSVFGRQMRFDLSEGFPVVTTKKVFMKAVIVELLWFLRGDSNVKWLQERDCTIWDEWANEHGDLGPVYGVQWRSWPAPDGTRIDQMKDALNLLRKDPNSRRIIVSAWNVADLDKMALMPCHALFQFWASPTQLPSGRKKLSCQVYQRSADAFIGVPFNIASYALLVHMVAREVGMDVGELVWTGGDCHIYTNHLEQVKTQLLREPLPLPQLKMAERSSIFDYEPEDFELVGYQHHPAIRGQVAV